MKESFFTISEMEKSQIATAKGIENKIPESLQINFKTLINDVLNPIRFQYGNPITVNSGYRSKELNEAIGGVATSHHTGIYFRMEMSMVQQSMHTNKQHLKNLYFF